MKILWASNGPNVPSGYGVPTKNILPYLLSDGHKVAVQAFYGIQGGSVNYGDIVVYPAQNQPYGVDVIGAHARHFQADLVVTLIDNWVLPVDYNARFDAKWLSWFPVDGEPAPESSVLQAANSDYPAVFSKHGVEQFKDAGVEVTYLPYAVDCSVFKPGDKTEARKKLDIPKCIFLIVTVGANKGFPARKSWPEILLAFKQFSDKNADARLYLHTNKEPTAKMGIWFEPLIRNLGLEEKVSFPNDEAMAVGVPNDELVTLYQAADVMLLPSMAEGFGLPIVEAQACGCPVITQACSSMTELTINGIAIEPGQPLWAPILSYWWRVPDVNEIVHALDKIYDGWCKPDGMLMGVEHFRKHYDYPVVYDKYWKPLLSQIESELW